MSRCSGDVTLFLVVVGEQSNLAVFKGFTLSLYFLFYFFLEL